MKKLTFFLTLLLALNVSLFAENEEKTDENSNESNDSVVRVYYKSDLIEDYPIDLVFKTTGREIGFQTILPTEEMDAAQDRIRRRPPTLSLQVSLNRKDEDAVEITTFWRATGPSDHSPNIDSQLEISTILKPGEEETLFEMGERKLIVGLLPDDD